MMTSRIGFRTRYHAQIVDAQSGQSIGQPKSIDNMVLNSGFTAMGNVQTFSALSIGASNIPVKETQTNLLHPVATVNLSNDQFKGQTLAIEGSYVTSTLTFTALFKDIQFPQSSNELTVYEIGVPGVTRAIFLEPLTLEYGQWMSVTMEVIFVYGSLTGNLNIPANGIYAGQTVPFTIQPYIANTAPNNSNGAGYGTTGALTGYLWDGTDSGLGNTNYGTQTLGLTVTPVLDAVNYAIHFNITGLISGVSTISGFVIVDNLNGGGFKISFPQGIAVQEDDSISMTISFIWAKDIS